MPKATKKAESSQRTLRTRTVPDMFMKQKTATNKRRMIQNVDSEEEEEEEQDEIQSSENESDSDNEMTSTQKRKRKTNKKTAAKNVASNIVLNTSSQLLEQVSQETSTQQDTLYDKALVSENSMEDVASDWIKEYKSNQMRALRNLINFVIRSSGCSMAVTAEALEQDDGSFNALQELQEELAKLPHTEYPIISRSKEYKALRRNLLVFFQELIEQCQHGPIYDGVLIETVQNWLTTMSSSLYRPFRHTATLVSLKIISQLCVIAEKSRDELAIANRQLNAEKKKKTSNTERMKGLKQKCTNGERKCKDLEEFLKDFFDSIFVHRSRDVESVIRLECHKELCNWMQSYQAFFVDNSYLRFFGWALNDQNATVRSEVIKSLIKLLKIEDIAARLGTFINRYKNRIEEMALYDIDVTVRVNAIQLCSTLYQLKMTTMNETSRTQLLNMIASDVPRIRKSAAPFVKTLINVNIIDPLMENVTQALTKRGRRGKSSTVSVNETWVKFKAIASFLVQQSASILENESEDSMQVDLESLTSNLAEKRNYIITNIIEALWDQLPVLQDYKAMTEYLSRDHSQSQQRQEDDDEMDTGNEIEDCYRLSEDEETVLLNVFVVCLRTAMVKGLDKNMPENKDRKKLDDTFWEENQNEISRHLVSELPKLVSKHLDDSNRIIQLVSVPTIMNLNVYLELRAENEYESLLQLLVRVYSGAIMTDLLVNCAASLQHMTKNNSLSEYNKIHIDELKETVVNQVREACSGNDLLICNFTPALIHSVSISMLRLEHLINFSDATAAMDDARGMSKNAVEYAGALVERAAFGNKNEQDIGLSAMSILSRYMMWKCNALSQTTNTNELVPDIERHRDSVLDKYSELIKGADVSPLPKVRVAAFGYLVDMYWLFSSELFDSFGLTRLKTRCPQDTQEACVDMVKEQIKAVKTKLDEFDADDEESKKALVAERELLHTLMTSFSRGIIMNVFDMKHAALVLEQYGSTDNDLNEVIKALVAEFKHDLGTGEVAADGICRAYLESLKSVFGASSADKALRLARIEAATLKVDENDANRIPQQIVCERIHLDGISFAVSTAAEAYQNNRDDERDNALKFFKVLTVFAKELSRARDIAKIHNHLEDCLQQNGIFADVSKKEWEPYAAYVKAIDQILKKKGLRYDATKRTNNAETPAAHEFANINLNMEDVDDLTVKDTGKRTLAEADMDIDDETIAKKRR